MTAEDAARKLAVDLGPFSVGRASPVGQAIIAQAAREAAEAKLRIEEKAALNVPPGGPRPLSA